MARETNAGPAGSGTPTSPVRFRFGLRFSPHIVVLLLTLLAAIPPLRGTIVSAVHWWWNDTYANVQYVMDEARPNDGHPYIAGHIDGSAGQRHLLGEVQGGNVVTKAAPQETFAPGKSIAIWHSPEAPNLVVFGTEVNDVPVAALPQRPGVVALLGYLAWLIATWVVGILSMAWVAHRWSRTSGELPMRGRPGSTLRR